MVGIALAVFFIPNGQLGTGFATLDTQTEGKYSDLFAAAEINPIAEQAVQIIEQVIENEFPSLRLTADVPISACASASGAGANPGDNLVITVPLNVTLNPCIRLDIVNVTFDCQNNQINGLQTGFVAVQLDSDNTSVVDCVFTNFSNNAKMIRINNANQTVISGNSFLNSTLAGGGKAIDSLGTPYNVTINNNFFDGLDVNNLVIIASVTLISMEDNIMGDLVYNLLNQPSTIRLNTAQSITMINNTFNNTLTGNGWTDALVERNSWYDLDGVIGIQAWDAMSWSLPVNVTVFNNSQIPMAVNLQTATNCTISRNEFENNGRIKMSGTSIGNRIISNVFDPVGIQLSASAGVTLFDNSLFKSNILANGVMNSIKVVGDNCTIRDNRIENVSGDAFLVEGNNNTFTNNTVYNFTGDVFRINGTNNRFFRNNVTYIIVLHNTTFNPNVSTPQVPIQYAGFVLESNANLTNISHNYVTAVNPSGLLNGIWGVRTAGVTFSNTVNNNSFTNLRTGVWIKDATQSGIMLNTLTNCVQRGIVVQNSQGTSVSNNTIIAPSLAASTDPYDASAGIYVYRHDDGYFADNNVSFYNIGLYLNNASNNTFERNVIKGPAVGRGVGIFSLYGQNNNFSQFVIYNQNIGVKLLYSNSSNFTGVNSTTGTTYGYQFFGSHDNIVQSSTITLGKTVNIEFSHFSANNVVNTCTLGVATDVDILYDLFATTNTGVGNGGPTQRQENGAAGNNIV